MKLFWNWKSILSVSSKLYQGTPPPPPKETPYTWLQLKWYVACVFTGNGKSLKGSRMMKFADPKDGYCPLLFNLFVLNSLSETIQIESYGGDLSMNQESSRRLQNSHM